MKAGLILLQLKIRHSYSKTGYPYDNSCIESFYSVLKKEEVNLRKYKDAYDAVFLQVNYT